MAEVGGGGCQSSSHPPNQPSVPSLLRKASSKVQGSSLQDDLVPVSGSAHVSQGTVIKDNVLFAQLDFILFRMLSPPKSLQEQLPGNTKYRFMIFVHFFFIVWWEMKAQKQGRRTLRAQLPPQRRRPRPARHVFIIVAVPF